MTHIPPERQGPNERVATQYSQSGGQHVRHRRTRCEMIGDCKVRCMEGAEYDQEWCQAVCQFLNQNVACLLEELVWLSGSITQVGYYPGRRPLVIYHGVNTGTGKRQ